MLLIHLSNIRRIIRLNKKPLARLMHLPDKNKSSGMPKHASYGILPKHFFRIHKYSQRKPYVNYPHSHCRGIMTVLFPKVPHAQNARQQDMHQCGKK